MRKKSYAVICCKTGCPINVHFNFIDAHFTGNNICAERFHLFDKFFARQVSSPIKLPEFRTCESEIGENK